VGWGSAQRVSSGRAVGTNAGGWGFTQRAFSGRAVGTNAVSFLECRSLSRALSRVVHFLERSLAPEPEDRVTAAEESLAHPSFSSAGARNVHACSGSLLNVFFRVGEL
jgi:hypothetical protein